MRPFSPAWEDPLDRSAPGRVRLLATGLRARVIGEGRPLVFLHGLGASLRYWGRGYDDLSTDHRLVFLDLLGFGGSAKPNGPYDAERHVAALEGAFDELGIDAPTIAAHSAGALIAMQYGTTRASVRVVAFGAPVFLSAEVARQHVRALGPLARLMADESPWAQRLCSFMCEHRELARRMAPMVAPRLPARVAGDGVDHSWDSYRGTFELIVNQRGTAQLLAALGERLTLIYGAHDSVCPPNQFEPLVKAAGGVRLVRRDIGDHHLPLQFPADCRKAIRDDAETHAPRAAN